MFIPEGAETIAPRYNIAPTQPIAVLPNDRALTLDYFVWGLIPSWAKDPKIGSRLINARGETVSEKPSFRAAYKQRRCLIFSDGFYEWVKQPGEKTKQPYYIHLKAQEPFAFAGLWEVWHAPDGSEVKSATIITTEPNEKIAKLHNRMPVILPPKYIKQWLTPDDLERDILDPMLTAYPAEEMTFFPVSRSVNSPANDTPENIRPL
jgi:putative SOS response-associated peptidase YedK